MQYTQYVVKDNAEAQLDSNIGASTLSIILNAGEGALFPQPYSGTTTSGGTSTTLNKTNIGSSGITAGDFIENTTDGSHAYVVSVSTHSLTTTELQGGSDNTWQNADGYLANAFIGTLNKRNATTGVITASEKVKIIGRSTDSLTVDPAGRGFDGSTAQSFVADDYFNLFVTAKPLQEMRKAFADVCQQLDLKASITYVQSSLSARTWKDPVVVATTVAGTLATSFENGDTIDGVVLATGDRILIKDQASPVENGIYVVAASGSPTRATDFDSSSEVTGAAITVIKGTSNADTAWICTSDSPTIGSSNIVFAQVGASINKASAAEAVASNDDTKYMTAQKVGLATQKRAFTLAENLVQGNIVKVISSSGAKVQKAKVTQSAAWKTFIGNANSVANCLDMVWLPHSNVFVIAWRDSTSSVGSAVVGRINEDGDLFFGSRVTFEASNITDHQNSGVGICWDSVNKRIVIAYGDAGATNTGKAIVGTVDENFLTISFGTKVQFEAGSVAGAGVRCCFDPVNGKVAIAYRDAGDTNKQKCIIGTVSGTSISFGTEVIYDTASCQDVLACRYDSVSGKVVIMYNNSNGMAIVGSISGTSITFGTAVQLIANVMQYQGEIIVDTVNSKVIFFYRSGADANGYARVGTISGTAISYGTQTAFEAAGNNTDMVTGYFDVAQGKAVVICYDASDTYYNIATVSGTNISFAGHVAIGSSLGAQFDRVFYHPYFGKAVIAYSSSGLKVGTLQLAGDYPDPINAFGIMQEAGNAAESKMVALEGGICNGFTSQTPGSKAYIQADYTVGTTQTPYLIGRFVSDTELLVTKTP